MSADMPACSFDVSQRQASSGSELLKAVPQTVSNLNITIKTHDGNQPLGFYLGYRNRPGLEQVEAVSQDLPEITWAFVQGRGI